MKRVLNDIRQQPQHVRELMAGLCTVVVVLLVVAAWFHSFQNNIYALLNEPAADSERFLAVENQSLFGSIGSSFKDFGLAIGQMFGAFSSSGENSIKVDNGSSEEVHLLPVWGNK